MKHLFITLALIILIVSCAKDTPKVLLFMRDGSPDLEYMLDREVGTMKRILEQSGFKVAVATLDGSSFSAGSIRMRADLALADVNAADYAGFMLPCMAAGNPAPQIPAEAVNLVKKAVSAGKPVAAQTGSVWALAEAGVLKGKKYASTSTQGDPHFAGAIYAGSGGVKDGLVLSSGICPYMARALRTSDGTEQLTRALVEVMKSKR
jgi:protease I